MKFTQYGGDTGAFVIYFHGAPGSPEEGEFFNAYARENGLKVLCPDRFLVDDALVGEPYHGALPEIRAS